MWIVQYTNISIKLLKISSFISYRSFVGVIHPWNYQSIFFHMNCLIVFSLHELSGFHRSSKWGRLYWVQGNASSSRAFLYHCLFLEGYWEIYTVFTYCQLIIGAYLSTYPISSWALCKTSFSHLEDRIKWVVYPHFSDKEVES